MSELPLGYIVYKEHEGLSTFYAKHKRDVPKPNYPVPALISNAICANWVQRSYYLSGYFPN